jgi:hypothetical protein
MPPMVWSCEAGSTSPAIRLYAPKPIAALSARALNRPLFRRHIISLRTPRAMARHCAREYANLATLLPELHRRFHERAQQRCAWRLSAESSYLAALRESLKTGTASSIKMRRRIPTW